MDLNPVSAAALALIISALALSSCGKSGGAPDLDPPRRPELPTSQGAAAGGAVCASGLAAFTQFVHAPILRKACINCHDVDGIGPAHSVADPAESYRMTKSYVSFSQPDNSRMMQHVRSKHWANYDASEPGVSEETMRAALQAWWDQGEKQCPDSATAQSASMVIPEKLGLFPADDFVSLEWELDSWGPAFVGSRLGIEIQRLATPTATSKGAYVLRKPRIATPQDGLSLEGFQFFINGNLQEAANEWGQLDARIAGHSATAPSSDPFALAPTLSSQNVILIQDKAQGDVLTVALKGAQFGAAPSCRALSVFQGTILPVIRKQSCVGCHGSASVENALSLDGRSRLVLAGKDEQVCAAVRERVMFAHPEASPFYMFGFLEGGGHPPVGVPPGDMIGKLRDWATRESAAREGGQ